MRWMGFRGAASCVRDPDVRNFALNFDVDRGVAHIWTLHALYVTLAQTDERAS